MTARCFFCGAAAAAGEDPHNALCETHRALHGHVVSMQRRGSRLAAECRCGWRFLGRGNGADRPGNYAERERAVEAHWRVQCNQQEATR